MHYPPTNKELKENSRFIDIMKRYNVKRCLYGHLHGEAKFEGIDEDVRRDRNQFSQF